MIPNAPKNQYHPSTAEQLLAVADTYLQHADRLIYSYGSKTFLSGYALYDEEHDGRGNIDCSTFLLLVLAGIPYEASPYATRTVVGLTPGPVFWAQTGLVDFSDLPKTYVDIAERIGRPYLACEKGLDLEKAAALGISIETLSEETALGALPMDPMEMIRDKFSQDCTIETVRHLLMAHFHMVEKEAQAMIDEYFEIVDRIG